MNSLLSRLLGLLLCVTLSPIILFISIMMLFLQGRPIFYKGERLGKYGKVIYIYKFRTMVENAEENLKGKVVDYRSNLKTPAGRFLRASRLDELPQLLNLASGEMNLFGPRPIRESVYATMGDYPNYHLRLSITPGLFGPTQILFPHTASKKIRFRFFRRFYFGDKVFRKQFLLLLKTLWALIAKSSDLLYSQVSLRIKKSTKDRRIDFRTQFSGVAIYSISCDGEWIFLGNVIDANSDFISVQTVLQHDLSENISAVICALDHSKKIPRWRMMYCAISTSKQTLGRTINKSLLNYHPNNDFQRYLIDKYLLKRSIC